MHDPISIELDICVCELVSEGLTISICFWEDV